MAKSTTQEFCPRCGELRSMRVTYSRRKLEGSAEKIGIKIYHCESCRAFVRDEVSCRTKGKGGG